MKMWLLACMCAKSLQSCLTLCDHMDLDCSLPGSMGSPRQEYWSGLPFLPPGDLPSPEIKHMFPVLAGGVYHCIT